MKRKKKLLYSIATVVIAGGSVLLYFHYRPTADATTYKTAAAEMGTLISTVSGSGNIIVAKSANVSPSISGTVNTISVSVGDTVTAGQTLFTITNDDLDLEVSQAYTALLQAQQKLTQAQDSLTTAQEDYADATSTAAVSTAELAYEQAKQDLAQAQYQLEQDEDLLDKYDDEVAADADAHTDTELTLQAQKITVDKANILTKQQAVTEAKTRINETNAGTTDEIEAAKTKVDDAELSVTIAENGVTSAEQDYESKKESAAERTVTAPIDGTISEVNVEEDSELGSGGTAGGTSSDASMVIQDLSSLKAVVDINEVDIASVEVDQKVTMTFDAISDLSLTGTVEEVDTLGTSNQGVVTYSATIGFDTLDDRVKPEMSVNATITIDVKQDVLIVSSSAVKTSGETNYVEVLEDGVPVQHTVEVGATNDTQTEIVSGIDEGTEVITQTITASDDSSSTSSSSSNNSFGTFRMLESSSGGFSGGPPGGGM